jgi:rhamnosyltransferase
MADRMAVSGAEATGPGARLGAAPEPGAAPAPGGTPAAASAPDRESVAAVVVTFHPGPDLAATLAALLAQAGTVVVVDNGSCPADLPAVDDAASGGRVEILANERNIGLAAALNQGLRRAQERGFGWALTMDQDSAPLPNLVAAAGRAFDAYSEPERLAAIGARVAGAEGATPTATVPYRRMKAVITSGTLHSVSAWERLGGFREDFFIDCVDTEFCLHARARGFEVVSATEPAIEHRIGAPTRKRALGRWMMPTNHSPLRRYYVTRNRLSLWRHYARSDGRFVLTDMRQSIREWVGIAFAETDRPAKLRAILAGFRDAALGRYGPRWLPGNPHQPSSGS